MRITKVLLKKKFKFFLKYKNIYIYIKLIIIVVLGLINTNKLTKKRNFKQNVISFNSPKNIIITFALLAKVILIYI